MRKFAILGLGTFGSSLAQALTEKGAEVIAVDRQMERVEQIQDYVAVAVKLDSTDENALKAQGILEVDVAIVCIGEDFESNLLTSVLLKQMGVPLVITRATKPIEEKILKAVGIDRVVLPEQESGERLAYSLMHPHFREIFFLGGQLSVIELKTPANFVGKTLEEIQLRRKYGLNLVTIQRTYLEKNKKGEEKTKIQTMIPDAKTVIEKDDNLILVGNKADIDKFLEKT